MHVDPHAIPMKNLVEHGIVLPPAAGRAEVDTHPAGCEPPQVVGMRLTGWAP